MTKPVAILQGESYSLCRKAELQWDDKAKASELVYRNGTGSIKTFGPLPTGRYQLSFWYSVSPKVHPLLEKAGDWTRWIGEVVTNEVTIEVLDQ